MLDPLCHILNWRFLNKVEKPSKIFTMGIGVYFITFILCWTLFISWFLETPTAAFNVYLNSPSVGDAVSLNATTNYEPDATIAKYQWVFGDGVEDNESTTTHIYSSAGDYTGRLTVVDDNGIGNTVVRDIIAR
jgi:PKD repeat protein